MIDTADVRIIYSILLHVYEVVIYHDLLIKKSICFQTTIYNDCKVYFELKDQILTHVIQIMLHLWI